MDCEAEELMKDIPNDTALGSLEPKGCQCNVVLDCNRTRLCIYLPEGGALFANVEHLFGDLAPGH